MHTHSLIRKTAMALAGAFYEIKASRDNQFFASFPSQKRFIQQDWKGFIPAARETLTDLLAGNETTEHVKGQIFDALVHERGLQNGILIQPEALH